ncbi:bifunctional protein-disulfide isomerase/oxidoreductase DsbC [Pseudoalteromonas xiamenensis]|uniref:Thiol:disulfide interchange protein n=1 Tax=Pseudoalteromonas xiamenensis TaxID=882626 RepID=A0A975HNM1_9GAMM|nr:bifunctional protein-disulfide isomerase/oxidoreductase DsbC [Pseudoalteromonas xiamenensis]QTH72355.1 bifunctional protein-disulfide isomerase/oxidoreductase DsbC [Pseudoalteromonas xiamenensis]
MKRIVLAAALLCGFGAQAEVEVQAAPSTEVAATPSPVVAKFAQLGIAVKEVRSNPIAGLVTLITDKGVLYGSPDGQYLIQGTLLDIDSRENLTENALSDVRKAGVSEFEDSMIVYKAENEKHQITVFTDITCGYCRKLHRELQDYLNAGITVRYMAFPRGGLRGKGYEDLRNVWCAKDNHKALTEAKAGNDVAKVEGCNAPVAEHYQLGQSFGISGTPAIILEDGTMIPGYQPADSLAQILDEHAKKS